MPQRQGPEITQDLVKHAKERAKAEQDPLYFALNYVRTSDEDDPEERIKPYPKYNYLAEFIYDLEEPGAVVVEKSRQMLISWTLMSVHALWHLLFDDGYSMLVVSMTGPKGDDGGSRSTPNSLMGMTRFSLGELPDWLVDKDAVHFAKNRITNLEARSSIKSESAERGARGGSYHTIFVDEFAHIPNKNLIHRSVTGSTYRSYIIVSTPGYEEDLFAKIAKNPHKHGFRKHRFHWTRHPARWEGKLTCGCQLDPKQAVRTKAYQKGKFPCPCGQNGQPTSDWYEQKRAEMVDEETVAIELDIHYGGAWSEKIFPEFDPDVHVYPNQHIEQPSEDLRYFVGFDRQYLNPTALVCAGLDSDGRWWIVDEFYQEAVELEDLMNVLDVWLEDYGFEQIRLGREPGDIYAKLEERGFPFHFVGSGEQDLSEGIVKVRRTMKPDENGVPYFLVHKRCRETISQIKRYRKHKFAQTGTFSDKPKSGQEDHLCFVAGTLVRMPNGEVPIETLSEGDVVATRFGMFPIKATSHREDNTVQLATKRGRVLRGTSDHPVLLDSDEWRHLGGLEHGDRIWTRLGVDTALSVEPMDSSIVYNLEVDGPSEYFANDVVVSNCDALRYVIASHKLKKPVTWISDWGGGSEGWGERESADAWYR